MQKDIKFTARNCKCNGEYRCRSPECDNLTTLQQSYVMKVPHILKGKSMPTCHKCNAPMTKIDCTASQTIVRMILPGNKGQLLVYRHKGSHKCKDLPKKGKGIHFDEDTKAAIQGAEVGIKQQKPEKLKVSTGVTALRDFLTGGRTKESLLNTVMQVKNESLLFFN